MTRWTNPRTRQRLTSSWLTCRWRNIRRCLHDHRRVGILQIPRRRTQTQGNDSIHQHDDLREHVTRAKLGRLRFSASGGKPNPEGRWRRPHIWITHGDVSIKFTAPPSPMGRHIQTKEVPTTLGSQKLNLFATLKLEEAVYPAGGLQQIVLHDFNGMLQLAVEPVEESLDDEVLPHHTCMAISSHVPTYLHPAKLCFKHVVAVDINTDWDCPLCRRPYFLLSMWSWRTK